MGNHLKNLWFMIIAIGFCLCCCGCNPFYSDDFYRSLNPKHTDDYVLIRDKVIAEDYDFFEKAFRFNPGLRNATEFGFNHGTVLYFAYEKKKINIAQWFLEHGVNPAIHNQSNDPPILGLFRNGSGCSENEEIQIVDSYLAHGGDMNAVDGEGRTLLGLAFEKKGSNLLAIHLLELGADPWKKSVLGVTQIHWCLRAGKADIAFTLLHGKTLVDLRAITPKPFLLASAYGGSSELMQLFLELGEDVNEIDGTVRGSNSNELNTPLHEAVLGGHPQAVEFLLGRGAEIERRNARGKTPLILAAENGLPDVVTILLKHGADPRVRLNDGNAVAWAHGHPKVAKMLQDAINQMPPLKEQQRE